MQDDQKVLHLTRKHLNANGAGKEEQTMASRSSAVQTNEIESDKSKRGNILISGPP